jgi:hypothetical protein
MIFHLNLAMIHISGLPKKNLKGMRKGYLRYYRSEIALQAQSFGAELQTK